MAPYCGGVRAMLALPFQALMLLCATVVNHSSTVQGAPAQMQSSDASNTAVENRGNRDGAFQVLADGSQDLAALVGLFATDGVERYTIDYTRGLVPPATAPLSLLGLLGYVRALLKLSFGVEFCERTGFSISSLRSYAGVRRPDVAQSERVVDVHYLERCCHEHTVQWRLIKTVPHIQESMPLITGGGTRVLRDRRPHEASFGIAMCRLPRSKGTVSLSLGLYCICLVFAASLSSFPVLIFTSKWTWTRIFASAGLPTSVFLGGMPWCVVHIVEHLPFDSCEWFRSDWKNGPTSTTQSADEPGQSLARKNSFAFFAKEDHFYIFDCRAVGTPWIWLTRFASCCAAICITVAYLCQYIELRSASARASGVWLGVQGFLAVVRIVAWDWAPNVLGFSSETEIRWTDQRDRLLKNSLTELELTLCWVSMSDGPLAALRSPNLLLPEELSARQRAPPLPKWLVRKMDGIRLMEAFATAGRLRADTVQSGDFRLIHDAVAHWDMPDCIFARWLQLRCRNGHDVPYNASKRRMGVATWICRILQDSGGVLHMIPGISLHVHFLDRSLPPSEIILFSRCRDREANIFSFPRGGSNETQVLYHGIGNIPDDSGNMRWVAKRSLEGIYRLVFDELWDELLLALGAMGLSGLTAQSSASHSVEDGNTR